MSRSPTKPPLVAGKYHLRDLLGQGAHGAVYRATHVHLGEDVALKLLKPEVASDEKTQKRFLREVKLSTSFVHRYVVQLRDFGREPDMDCLYFTMDLVEGPTLEDVLEKEGSIEVRHAVHLIGQLLEALEEAHRAGIVHRDLKPANLILTEGPDKEAEIRVLDFGVAKAVSESRQEAIGARSALTMTGTLVGTLHYMAPEQAQGMQVDPRSDLYAVAVLLYELVSGRRPVEPDPKAVSPLQSFLFRLTTVAPRPLRKVAPHVSPELEAVVMRALHKRPDQRWQSAREMRRALKKVPLGKSRQRKPASRTRADALTSETKLEPRDRERAETRPTPRSKPKTSPTKDGTRPKTKDGTRPKTKDGTRPRTKDGTRPRTKDGTQPKPREGEGSSRRQKGKKSSRTTDTHSKRSRKAVNLPPGVSPGPRKGEFLNERDGSLLVWVPPGTFTMGADRGGRGKLSGLFGGDNKAEASDHPPHEVTLTRGYFIGRAPVTWKQYRRFCLKTGRTPPTQVKFPADIAITDKHPAVNLTWNEVQAYCRWANLRLPREAEWEFAARSFDGRRYPWGDEPPSAKLLNWGGHPVLGRKSTSPVGTFPRGASPFGCLDMAGNVWEWVEDWYGDYRPKAQTDPVGPRGGKMRVIRGGCWGSDAEHCEASRRFALEPHRKKNVIGFRVCLSG